MFKRLPHTALFVWLHSRWNRLVVWVKHTPFHLPTRGSTSPSGRGKSLSGANKDATGRQQLTFSLLLGQFSVWRQSFTEYSKKRSTQSSTHTALSLSRLRTFWQQYLHTYLETPTRSKAALHLTGVALFGIGIGLGSYFTLSEVFLPRIRALSETTLSQPTELPFNQQAQALLAGYSDGDGTTYVLSTEITLATSSSWFQTDYQAKQVLTIKNLNTTISLATQSATTTSITLNTKALFDQNKLQADCSDLRIVYAATHSADLNQDGQIQGADELALIERRELPRSITTPDNLTCATSTATTIAFPLQQPLWKNGGTDSYYELYYHNPTAANPNYGDNGYDIARADGTTVAATLVCPFNGSTKCADGETPTTQTGAIRYSGTKSAMSFDGVNDYVSIGDANGQFDFTTEFTAEAYIKVPANNCMGCDRRIIFKEEENTGFSIWMYNENICLKVGDGTNNYACTVGGGYINNSWHHVALTAKSGDKAILYYDGIPIINRSIGQLRPNDIGLNLAKQSSYWQGNLDELRISNTVRYTGNFTPQTTPFETDDHTKLLLHFDENGDDPRYTGKAIDSSGNNNHGTITGAKYVSGLVGVDVSSTDTGAVYSSSNQGIFIEEGTTNLITNPSFENATSATLNWGTNYFTYATASATFTPNMAKRNSAGPFAAGPIVQGKMDLLKGDLLSFSRGSQLSGNFYSSLDSDQGSLVMWITPEWNGNDNNNHFLLRSQSTTFIKTSYNTLDAKFWTGSTYVIASADVSTWIAGNTYSVVIRWDRDATLDGTNYASISINDVHNFGANQLLGNQPPDSTIILGSDVDTSSPANAIIEGLTIYRRPLFDGTYGIDVGNGDEIAQIYNSGTGKDPTLITGSWDVVFALPTNASTGTLSTGTGNAWSHPHSSNLLYTSTTNTGGFMMNGTASNDGWSEIPWYKVGGSPGVVAAYQPIGAASYTASKTNIANPGTYNATEGVAPSWDATNGWVFDGSTQWLNTTVVPQFNQTWSILAKMTGYRDVNGERWSFGATGGGGTAGLYYKSNSSCETSYYSNGNSVGCVANMPAFPGNAVVAISGQNLYYNGSVVNNTTTSNASANTMPIYVGGVNVNGSIALGGQSQAYQAFAVYNVTLNATQVANVTDAMEALDSDGSYLTISSLSSSEKIFSGGYKYTSTGANQGIYRSFTATNGGDYVLRALGHSDGTCNPQVKITRADGTTEISHLNGTTTSTRTDPDVYIFTWESPAAEENQVQLLNTATSGTCYWHQVEVLSNLVTNPSLETGSGDPWAPTGWLGGASGEIGSSNSMYHSGNASLFINLTSWERSVFTYNVFTTIGKFYGIGGFTKNLAGNGMRIRHYNADPSRLVFQSNGTTFDLYNATNSESWNHVSAVGNNKLQPWNSAIALYAKVPGSQGYFDDIYTYNLNDVSLTITPASQTNSTETSGLRVDGADTLTQPITNLSATSGVIKFKFTPRHNFSDTQKYGHGTPTIFLTGSSPNYLHLYRPSGQTYMRLLGSFNGTAVTADWASPTLNAGTTYSFEISYRNGGNLSLTVDGVQVATSSGVVSFASVPTTAYLGTDNVGSNQYEGTFSNFTTLTPTVNTSTPYYKFGSKSTKLVNGGTMGDEYTTSINPASTSTHTLSAYVYNGTTGAIGGTVDSSVAKLVFNNAVVTPSSYTDMGGGWWRLVYSAATQNQAGNYGVHVLSGKTVYVDGVQLEAKTYATTYADGSLGTGYSWSGTANDSFGVRTSSLSTRHTDNIFQGSGTLSFWQKMVGTWSTNGTWDDYLIAAGPVVLQYNPQGNIFNAGFNQSWGHPSTDNGSIPRNYSNYGKAYFVTDDKWVLTTLSWKNGEFRWYRNNSLVGQDTIFVPPETQVMSNIYTGKNLVTSDLRIYDKALSSTEVADLYYQGLSTHGSGDVSTNRYSSTGTYTSPVIDLGAAGGWGATPLSFTNLVTGTNLGTIGYATRTSPDNSSWSEWSNVASVATPSSDLLTADITSPARRYFQWKADLTAGTSGATTPVITNMSVAYVADTTAPTNPDAVALGYSSSSTPSADLTSNTWYNYPTPTFTFDSGEDTAASGQSSSGISTYRLLLTADESATPSSNLASNCYREVSESEDGSTRVFSVGSAPASCSLTDNTYYLRIQAVDNSGNIAPPATIFTYRYDGSLPTAPPSVATTNIGYQATNTFTFFWPQATDQGPSGIAGYEYKTGASDADWTFTTSTIAADIPAYQEGQNFFYVRTKDTAGNYSGSTSNNVAAASFYYNQSAPTAPTSVVITPATSSTAPSSSNVFTVTWDKPATYSGEIAKYYYCVNCTPSASTMTETTSAETVGRTLTTKALATQQGKNTFYIVAEDNNVNAETGHGNRNFEAYASTDFYASTIAPGAPQALSVTDASDRDEAIWRLTLAWKAPSSGGTPTIYDIYRSSDNTTFTKVGDTSSTAFTDADLTQSTTYYYRVVAIDDAGSTSLASNTVSLSPEGRYTAPPAAGGVPSVSSGSTTATITWTTSRDAYGSVEYGKSSTYGSSAGGVTATSTHTVKLTGLIPGTTYHYRTQSLDDSGLVGYERSKAYSKDYEFTTQVAAQIADVKVESVDLSSAVVSWTATSLQTAQVEYGTTKNYGETISISVGASASAHTARLTNLDHSTEYHFRIKGTDIDGNDLVSDDYTLTTQIFPVVTAVVFNTDQSSNGTAAVLGWSTNVATTSRVVYQQVGVDPAARATYPDLFVDAAGGQGTVVNLATLQGLSPTQLSALPIIPLSDAQTIYDGALSTQKIQRITSLKDGSLYVFTLYGTDEYGNEAISTPIRYVTGQDTKPPAVSNIIIETPITGVGAETKSQIIVSFTTDEPARAQLHWGQGTGSEYPSSTELSKDLTTEHVLVLRDLQPTSTYHLQIKTTDATNNTTESEDMVVVTPAAQEAAFDIILSNLEGVFGFLRW